MSFRRILATLVVSFVILSAAAQATSDDFPGKTIQGTVTYAALRSTVIQVSPVHSGFCSDPTEALEHLMETMVSLPKQVGEKSQDGA
jgi:DUF3037 family protein